MNYLSLNSAKQLKEWGCEVPCKYFTQSDQVQHSVYEYESLQECEDSRDIENYKYSYFINVYSLNEIICNGEMAKAFFGDKRYSYEIGAMRNYAKIHTEEIMSLLYQNKQEEAEQYLLDNCVFNL